MIGEDTLQRLAELDLPASVTAGSSLRAWLEQATEEDILYTGADVVQFARLLGLALEKLGPASDLGRQKLEEALAYYALAVWKAYRNLALTEEERQKITALHEDIVALQRRLQSVLQQTA